MNCENGQYMYIENWTIFSAYFLPFGKIERTKDDLSSKFENFFKSLITFNDL